jgi:Flp pilus assembly protein TadB
MTLWQFCLDYLNPFDSCSVAESTAGKKGKLRRAAFKDDPAEMSADDTSLGSAAAGKRPTELAKGEQLNLNIALRPGFHVYIRRWFILCLALFVLAWAASTLLTIMACLAGLVGLVLMLLRNIINNRSTQ